MPGQGIGSGASPPIHANLQSNQQLLVRRQLNGTPDRSPGGSLIATVDM
jgi:hypothetical protein